MTSKRFKLIPKTFTCDVQYKGTTHHNDYNAFCTIELKSACKIRSQFIDTVSTDLIKAKDSMSACVLNEYLKVLQEYGTTWYGLFVYLSEYLAEVDVLYSAAKCSIDYGYIKPQIIVRDEGSIQFTGIRHPIIERINTNQEYIPNNFTIGVEGSGAIIYGLNMCGKSSLLKSIGCNLVLAQAGFWVAAESMIFSPFTVLLSKMTIKDNMAKGQSTFMVEMLEVKTMLSKASSGTLVLSDELCSSTESISAHAIVAQTLHELSTRGARFVFSTHLHELQKMELITADANVCMYHFKVHISPTGDGIVFDRTLSPGGLQELYGIEVAKAIGLPSQFIIGALKIRDKLTGDCSEILCSKESRYNPAVYMHQCEKCGSRKDLHTHHIQPQCTADPKTGLVQSRFHKNAAFNLQVLCEKCHVAVHQSEK